jgi:hypothetical protein
VFTINYDDRVNVIRHYHVLVDENILIVLMQGLQFGFCDQTNRRELKLCVDYLPENASPIVRADGNELPSTRAIVPLA